MKNKTYKTNTLLFAGVFIAALACVFQTAHADRQSVSPPSVGKRTSAAPRYSAWSAPVNLGAPVNGPGLDGCPFITKNGLDLIFATNRPSGVGPTDLYVSHRETLDGAWGEPISLGPDLNTAANEEFCPALTISGRYLYFVSNRPGGCGNADIYVARRLDKNSFSDWSQPENLGCQVNGPGPDLSPSLFEDDDGTLHLYFSSGLRPGGMGFGDIYYSTLQNDGTFSEAVPILEFNTPSNDIRPNIRARDGLEIFFDSNRPGTIGLQDLYTSKRECVLCAWSTPENLGVIVNSGSIDGKPSLSFDGTELYFMSNRPGGSGDQDIYIARRERLTGRPN
jgi:hypothetical protein